MRIWWQPAYHTRETEELERISGQEIEENIKKLRATIEVIPVMGSEYDALHIEDDLVSSIYKQQDSRVIN